MDLSRILIATDFSESAAVALRAAADLALAHGGELHVLHVHETLLDVAPLAGGEREAAQEFEEPLRRRLESWVAERVPPDVAVRSEVRDGDPAREILGLAEETRARLIVMGRHGRSALERFFLGSVTEEVIRRAPCAVMVLPPARK